MDYQQVIPFDQRKAGTVPTECLSNVRQGYGIPKGYKTAWQAWLHTQQHTDQPPLGVDVPLYYSYTTTIDKVTDNYGHINVRLANGTVWSDGNIYANIQAYTANHKPMYVGWGESINDVTVLKGDNMDSVADKQDVKRLALGFFGEDYATKMTEQFVQDNVGTPLKQLISAWISAPEALSYRATYNELKADGETLKPGRYIVL